MGQAVSRVLEWLIAYRHWAFLPCDWAHCEYQSQLSDIHQPLGVRRNDLVRERRPSLIDACMLLACRSTSQ
jgi:hypothetical protein